VRKITFSERAKHGCGDCIDKIPGKSHGCKCPYASCPYHEIDDYDSYEAYLEATKPDFLLLI